MDKRAVREKVGHALRDNYHSETEASDKSLKRIWDLRKEIWHCDTAKSPSLSGEEESNASNLSDQDSSTGSHRPQPDFMAVPARNHALNITNSAPSFLMNSQPFDRLPSNRADLYGAHQIDYADIPQEKSSPRTASTKSLGDFPIPPITFSSLMAEDIDVRQLKQDTPPEKCGDDDPLDAFDKLYEDGLIQIDHNERTLTKLDNEYDFEPIDAFPSLMP